MIRFSLTALVLPIVFALGASGATPVPVPRPSPAAAAPSPAPDRSLLKSVWTQIGPEGALEVRAVIEGANCPPVFFDLHRSAMIRRAAQGANFPAVCAAMIPTGTRQAALVFPARESGYDIVPLPLAAADPQRIVVLGDTGCRIKGKTLQDCSDPVQWPFARIAAEAARLKPDLVIHVGDFLYRESPCPADFKGCAGTPYGDNWPTWDADFFAPAKPLLAAAPWVMVRGNHEDCGRAGAGWLRLMGPAPFDPGAPCTPHLAPYTIPFGSVNMVVMDNVDAPDTKAEEALVPVYRGELAALAQAGKPSWLLLHKPIWAAIKGPLGIPAGGNLTMISAAGRSGIPAPVELMLAGHIHSFEAINYAREPRVPPQIVAGHGGDLLDETPVNLRGTVFQGDSGVRVSDGISVGGFGFAMMTRTEDGWAIDLHDWKGAVIRQCAFRAGRVECPRRR